MLLSVDLALTLAAFLSCPFSILFSAANEAGVPETSVKNSTFVIDQPKIEVRTDDRLSWLRRWPMYVYAIMKGLLPGQASTIDLPDANVIHVGMIARL
jgi:hypothetical protein